LQEQRKSKGLSQREVAQHLEGRAEPDVLSKVENGRISASTRTLRAYARAFGVGLSELSRHRDLLRGAPEPTSAVGSRYGGLYTLDRGDYCLVIRDRCEELCLQTRIVRSGADGLDGFIVGSRKVTDDPAGTENYWQVLYGCTLDESTRPDPEGALHETRIVFSPPLKKDEAREFATINHIKDPSGVLHPIFSLSPPVFVDELAMRLQFYGDQPKWVRFATGLTDFQTHAIFTSDLSSQQHGALVTPMAHGYYEKRVHSVEKGTTSFYYWGWA
jgi:transcriptional regulator with XRE-family HTH domain